MGNKWIPPNIKENNSNKPKVSNFCVKCKWEWNIYVTSEEEIIERLQLYKDQKD